MATKPEGGDRVVLTIDELKELNKAGVLETLKALGIDADNPQEVQRDFYFIRDWRKATETCKGTMAVMALGTVVTGLLAALWLGLKSVLNN